MKRRLPLRFLLETGMATLTSILLVITVAWPQWIEMAFHVSPDGGNGSSERLIVGSCLVLTIALFLLARREWQVSRAAT